MVWGPQRLLMARTGWLWMLYPPHSLLQSTILEATFEQSLFSPQLCAPLLAQALLATRMHLAELLCLTRQGF